MPTRHLGSSALAGHGGRGMGHVDLDLPGSHRLRSVRPRAVRQALLHAGSSGGGAEGGARGQGDRRPMTPPPPLLHSTGPWRPWRTGWRRCGPAWAGPTSPWSCPTAFCSTASRWSRSAGCAWSPAFARWPRSSASPSCPGRYAGEVHRILNNGGCVRRRPRKKNTFSFFIFFPLIKLREGFFLFFVHRDRGRSREPRGALSKMMCPGRLGGGRL